MSAGIEFEADGELLAVMTGGATSDPDFRDAVGLLELGHFPGKPFESRYCTLCKLDVRGWIDPRPGGHLVIAHPSGGFHVTVHEDADPLLTRVTVADTVWFPLCRTLHEREARGITTLPPL